ncbi:MAG: carboxypeptidase-like regulatory domain-containing protein [Bacteroidota bacterium]
MKKQFNLNIQKPCGESFDNFQKTQAGGFCQSCQKEVIDFSEMSEREIVHFFQNQAGKACGHFRAPQLKAYTVIKSGKRKNNFALLGAGLMGFSLLSLLNPQKSQAQEKNPPPVSPVNHDQASHQNGYLQKQKELGLLEGLVLFEGEPLPGVNVIIKGTHWGTVTDMNGRFSLSNVPDGSTIIFQSVGFNTQERVYKEYALDIMRVDFKNCEMRLMGEVAVEEIYASKPSIWQRIKNLFR